MFPILLANFSTIAAVTNSSLPPRAYLTLSFISSTEGIFFPMFQESRYCAYPLCHSRCIIYILNPTSNHNVVACEKAADRLYIFWFLHQTTTVTPHALKVQKLYIFWFLHQTTTEVTSVKGIPQLYIFWFLHQTTTDGRTYLCCRKLYIFWFLHQTTTDGVLITISLSCISFDSYIKPQLSPSLPLFFSVVYLLIPTSNYNL